MWASGKGLTTLTLISLNYSMTFHLPVVHLKKGPKAPLFHISNILNYN